MMNKPMSLKARALRYLSTREYSRKELANKLASHVQTEDDLDALLMWLEEKKFLSEERFTESFVRARAKKFGASRILRELENHDIDPVALEETKASLAENEMERAQTIWQRKFGRVPLTPSERAKQAQFMQYRGFSLELIRKLWKNAENDE